MALSSGSQSSSDAAWNSVKKHAWKCSQLWSITTQFDCKCFCKSTLLFSPKVMSDSLRPIDCSPSGSSVHGMSQASGLPFPSPGDLPDSGIKPTFGLLHCRRILYHWVTREANLCTSQQFHVQALQAIHSIFPFPCIFGYTCHNLLSHRRELYKTIWGSVSDISFLPTWYGSKRPQWWVHTTATLLCCIS